MESKKECVRVFNRYVKVINFSKTTLELICKYSNRSNSISFGGAVGGSGAFGTDEYRS